MLRRAMLALLAGAGAALGAAVVLAILGLYLSGHGQEGLGRELVNAPAWGIHLSAADLLLLAASLLASALSWWLSGRD